VQDRVKAVVEVRRAHTSAARWRTALETVARPEKALSDSVAAELQRDPIATVNDVGDPVILWNAPSTT